MLKIEAKTEMSMVNILVILRKAMGGTVGYDRKPYVTTLKDGRMKVTGRDGFTRNKRFVIYPAVDGIYTILAEADTDDIELVIAERVGPKLILGPNSSVVITPMRAGERFAYLSCFN